MDAIPPDCLSLILKYANYTVLRLVNKHHVFESLGVQIFLHKDGSTRLCTMFERIKTIIPFSGYYDRRYSIPLNRYTTSIYWIEELKFHRDVSRLKIIRCSIEEASEKGLTDVVKSLLSDINCDPTVRGDYALRHAAENGHYDVVKLLLSDPRTNPQALINYAIDLASNNGHYNVVKLLLEKRVLDEKKLFRLYYSRSSSSITRLSDIEFLPTDSIDHWRNRLSMNVADPSDERNRSIRDAARNGRSEIVKLLLQDLRVNPGDYNNVAIQNAAANGHYHVVKLLLSDVEVDPKVDDNYALRKAKQNGHWNVVKLLEQERIITRRTEGAFRREQQKEQDRINRENAQRKEERRQIFENCIFTREHLMNAVKSNDVDLIKKILKRHYVETTKELKIACRLGRTEIVKLLLKHGICDAKIGHNYPIRHAARNGHVQIVKILLNCPGVDPNDLNNYALRYATTNHHCEIVKLLSN